MAGTVGCKGRRCANGQQAQTKDDPRSRPNNNATSDHESRLPSYAIVAIVGRRHQETVQAQEPSPRRVRFNTCTA
ncbi:hypothetical protein NK6_9931 [Bradyrhizobium diazoefficiens]|uniref:Uncharacterized protein n=1 Tax=Bradyrhizobium diazoefficiens TaxID=1355477 RepID=A0A0E3VXQ4_9BRAD|nr:hypothetical protein NK6_9931 [Bradyrhizobium diazoefficiens]